MESSIAVFLMRWVACELPPTVEQSVIAGLLLIGFPLSGAFMLVPIHSPVYLLGAYLIGLSAMIKCSICPSPCDN